MNEPAAPDSDRLQEMMLKVVTYQYTLWEDRPVPLAELQEKHVLSPADLEFISAYGIRYVPHRLAEANAGEMFVLADAASAPSHVLFPGSPYIQRPLTPQALGNLVETLLLSGDAPNEILLHAALPADDALAVTSNEIGFVLKQSDRQLRAERLKGVAAEHGLGPLQDTPHHGDGYLLALPTPVDPAVAGALVTDLLRRGCGLAEMETIPCVSRRVTGTEE